MAFDFQEDDNSIDFQLDFQEDKQKTSFTEDNAIAEAGIKNTFTKAGLMGLGQIATLLGDTNTADEIYRDMEQTTAARLKAANPEGKEQGTVGKLYGIASTLPAQLLAMPFSPADTGQTMVQKGETLGKSMAGAGIDTVGNLVGFGLPAAIGKKLLTKAVSGAAINAAQDTAVRGSIAGVADTQAVKDEFGPTWETAALAAVPGAAIGALHTKKAKAGPSITDEAIRKQRIIDSQKANAGREVDPVIAQRMAQMTDNDLLARLKALDEQLGREPVPSARNGVDVRTDLPEVMPVTREGQGMVNPQPDAAAIARATQMQRAGQAAGDSDLLQRQLLDPDNQGKAANSFEAQEGLWRIDENGMPVRADLSMELQNLENPLQRNMWGDELPVRENPRGQSANLMEPNTMPENVRGITEAMDATRQAAETAETVPAAEAARAEMEAQSTILSHDIGAPPRLERARMDADIAAGGNAPPVNPLRRTSPGGRQTGGINLQRRTSDKLGLADDPRLKDLYHRLIRGDALNQKEQAVVRALEKDGFLGFDNPTKAVEGVLSGGDYDLTPATKAAITNMATSAADMRPRSPGNRQTGGILLRGRGKPALLDKLKKQWQKSESAIPDNPDPKMVVSEALKEGVDSAQWNMTESGGVLAAMKRRSAGVLGVTRITQNAVKRGELQVKQNVMPTESAFRRLGRDEVLGLHELMQREMVSGKRFDPKALDHLSVRQQEAYANMRHMMEDVLRVENEARALRGEKPITEMEAYLSSRWEGDHRRAVYQIVLDRNGNPIVKPDGTLERKLVWYLAAHSKRGLEKQFKALKKKHPDLDSRPEDDHIVRSYKKQTDLQSQLTKIIDIIGRDDPAVELIQKAAMEQSINEAATFLGHEKHFEEKAGIRGFIGDRPGREGSVKEALAMFQQQIQRAKNGYKWAELQKSADDIKVILTDPDLLKQQPNNMKYAKEYWKNNLGFGEARFVADMEDAIRNLGFSPSQLDKGIGNAKSFFILQKLAANTGYTMANLLQTANVMPHLADMYHKFGGNPVTSPAIGIMAGMAAGMGHYLSYNNKIVKVDPGHAFKFLPKDNFFNRAFKYAEDNGVTSRALYDESPIESSFSKIGRVANIAGKTMSVPETFVRSMAFMTYANMLKSSKKFKTDAEIFQLAEERVNASMVDYRRGERPMVFEKLGIAGNFLNTLQTFPVNWYNQWNWAGREAMKGNVMPAVTMFTLQYGVAGLMGIPGFNDAMDLYELIKDHVVSNTTYAKMRDSKFWSNPKVYMIENFGSGPLYGELSNQSGLSLTSRVQAPGAGQMLESPAGPITDIAKQAWNLGSAVIDPTNTSKWGQAAMASTPPGLQGALEQAPFMEGITYDKRVGADGQPENVYKRPGAVDKHTGVVTRSPGEETIRNFGLRSHKEAVTREMGYMVDKDKRVAETRARSIPDAFYDATKRGDVDRARELFQAHAKLTGKGISREAFEAQLRQNYMTTLERSATGAKTVTALKDIARMRKIMDDLEKEHGNQ